MDKVTAVRRRGRPPKQLAGFSETREALVRAGIATLTEKGFTATGIDEILKVVAVPKGSFYHYFESKEKFGAELIARYASYFAGRLDRFFLDSNVSPLQRIKNFAADAERGMARYAYRRGCLVGNLGQEMSALPESYRKQLSDVLKDWEMRTARCLQEAKISGEIPETANPKELAGFFWIGWEGAVLRAKLERSPKPLRAFARGFFAGIEG